jgi:transposase-like protein
MANELERENRELRQANEILRKGETIFRHWSEELPVEAPLL